MLKYDTIKNIDDEYVMHTYNRMPALFVQGSGCNLWDNRGNEYLDMLAGIAVDSLGHCHPAVVSAITRQAQQLIHCSNLLLNAPTPQLAKRLCEISGMEKVFFNTDGSGANETAIKIAKKHGNAKCPAGDYAIVTLELSFHGRTLGSLTATGQPKYQEAFAPLVPGFVYVPVNDIAALKAAVNGKTAAILLEPILGESGVIPLTTEFLQEARKLADANDAFLMLDEVQTGVGRTGTWFNFQQHGIEPDVLCLAKGLGGGMPIGACLARGKAATMLVPGDHGTTFGGNPLMCAAALAVLDTIEHQDLLSHVKKVGEHLQRSLKALGGPITQVRGAGLMVGAVLDKPIAKEVLKKCFENGLIINAPDDSILRFVPPLVITEGQVDQAMAVLADALGVPKPVAAVAAKPAARPGKLHDVLSIDDLSAQQVDEVLSLASFLKQRRKLAPSVISPIEGRTVAMVFEKQSLRTRMSFETAVQELGGHAIYLTNNDIGINTREALKDIASNVSRWSALIVARLYWQKDIVEFAEVAEVPVVNALTELEHPCQALADLMTIREVFGEERVPITYVGDGNNVARSLAKIAKKTGYPFTICGPANFRLEDLEGHRETDDLEEGLTGAKVVYTDVWVSMGDEREKEHRMKVFEKYQVNSRMMSMAPKDAIFMHCLPARRGLEVTDDVIDSTQSRVVDQAENRLHAQKALLQTILGI
jgi:acetylornithine/N-succinyldiaminopimelate aminotransferase